LEIVPITDPTAERIGDELVSGFFLTANQCRQMFLPPMTASADTTTPTPTRIKITDPAAWLVRVERRMAAAEKDYDFQMFKAILVFPVQ
jgi:hypothetical protein